MIKDKIKEYQRKSWKLKRDNILRRDNYTCCRCGRKQADGAILNVHHLVYFKKTKIYDYPDGVLETLCSTCHLEEHGKIMPQSGWIYEDWDDTEEYGAEHAIYVVKTYDMYIFYIILTGDSSEWDVNVQTN